MIVQNFVANGQTVAKMAIFYFSKLAHIRHLGFVVRTFGPLKGIFWSLSLSKIWLNR